MVDMGLTYLNRLYGNHVKSKKKCKEYFFCKCHSKL